MFLKSVSYILVHISWLVTLVLPSGKMNGGLLTPPSYEILTSLPQECQQLFVPFAPFMIPSLHFKKFA